MKTNLLKSLAIAVAVSLSPLAQADYSGGVGTIQDNYTGSGTTWDHSPSNTALYDNWTITAPVAADGTLDVTVATGFGSHEIDTSYQYGDLFFTVNPTFYGIDPRDGTTPDLAAYNRYDDMSWGQWDYVVHIPRPGESVFGPGGVDPENAGDITGAPAVVYQIDYTQGDPRKNTRFTSGHARNDQEWGVDVTSSSLTQVAGATWGTGLRAGSSTLNDNFVAFNFNLADVGIPDATGDFQLAYHWTMSCGNDVIEGVLDYSLTPQGGGGGGSVPEPATLALTALGLLGMARVQRRRRPV